MKLVGVVSPGNIGETFLLWSLEYLSGNTTHVDPLLDLKFDIADNPLTDRNCHHFHKVRLSGVNEINYAINYYKKNGIELGIFFPSDRDSVISTLVENNASLILLDYSSYDLVYSNIVNRSGLMPDGKISGTEYEAIIQKHFYKNETLDVFSLPERRERFAMGMSFIEPKNLIDQRYPHYRISTDDLWNDFDNIIIDLFTWLDIPIAVERMENWTNVYLKWRQFHMPHKKFSRDVDTIVDAIVNGEYFELGIYELDFFKEAVILSKLISKHKKSVKLVDKFPTNTKDFSTILEDYV